MRRISRGSVGQQVAGGTESRVSRYGAVSGVPVATTRPQVSGCSED